jgi:hypothetical protein
MKRFAWILEKNGHFIVETDSRKKSLFVDVLGYTVHAYKII